MKDKTPPTHDFENLNAPASQVCCLGRRVAQAEYAPESQVGRAGRRFAAWEAVLPRQKLAPMGVRLGVLGAGLPPGRTWCPGRISSTPTPPPMGVRLGVPGAGLPPGRTWCSGRI